jgi:hypothetical protein
MFIILVLRRFVRVYLLRAGGAAQRRQADRLCVVPTDGHILREAACGPALSWHRFVML